MRDTGNNGKPAHDHEEGQPEHPERSRGHVADTGNRATRAASGSLEVGGTGAGAAAVAASAPATARGRARAKDAAKVARTMTDISGPKRVPQTKRARSEFLRTEATKTKGSTGPAGKSGARGRLKGHLFEDLDIDAYNKAGTKHALKKRANPRQQTYDADRFVDGKYAGSIQHKSSAAGADSAIAKMDQHKAGSAQKGTIRVPGDQADETRRRAHGRARVQGSEVTTKKLESTLDDGLDELAKRGSKGTSETRAAARGAARAAATSVAIGGATEARALIRGTTSPKTFAQNRARDASEAAVGTTLGSALERVGKASSGRRALAHGVARSATVTIVVSSLRDIPALTRGDLSGRDFVENRGVDAVETATAATLATVASGAVLATATGSAAAASVGAGAASGAAATAGAIGGMGGVGAAGATALGAVSATVAGPAILGGAVVIGSGIVVGQMFKLVRGNVTTSQQTRRELNSVPAPILLPAAASSESDANVIEIELALRGRYVFTSDELATIRVQLEIRDTASRQQRDTVNRRLRRMGFYISDWVERGGGFGAAEFNDLVRAGVIAAEG